MAPRIPGTVTADNLRRERGDQLWREWDKLAQKEGLRCTVYWPSGERYQGEWQDNLRHGKGTLTYKNGDKYEGDWYEGLRQGLGSLWIFDQSKYRARYTGEWYLDKPSGYGVYRSDNGDVYEGGFLNGEKHGRGKMVFGGMSADGSGRDVYEGDWMGDLRQGCGTMTYTNGDLYEGQWHGDHKHGHGTFFFFEKRKRFDGMWEGGIAKCGEYQSIDQLPKGVAKAPELPVLELRQPQQVLDRAKNSTKVMIAG